MISKFLTKVKMAGFPLGKLRTIFRKVPVAIWGAFAVIGILAIGLILGFQVGVSPRLSLPTPAQEVQMRNDRYLDLIHGYEDLARLYTEQGGNVATVLNKETIINEPEKALKALEQVDQLRDFIMVQMGRIIELRRSAGLSEDVFQY